MDDQAIVSVTLNGLLDEALSELTPWQKWVVERNFRRQPQNRRQALHAVEMHLAMTDNSLMAVMDGENFTADTPFKTTVAGKRELLQVIIDNLPAILDAILKIIGLFGAILLACMLLPSSASASDGGAVVMGASSFTQGVPNCANNGVCAVRARAAGVLQAVSHASTRVTSEVTTEIHTRTSLAVTSTQPRFRHRPVRSFLGSFRPRKRC